MSSPQHFPTGGAKSLPWNWSEHSGKRPRFSTPSITGHPGNRLPTGFPAITQIRQLWPSTRWQARRSTSTTSAGRWSRGKASSLAARGRTTTLHSQGAFVSFRRQNVYLHCGGITRRCETCIYQSPLRSMMCSRRWQSWKAASTSLAPDSACPIMLPPSSLIRAKLKSKPDPSSAPSGSSVSWQPKPASASGHRFSGSGPSLEPTPKNGDRRRRREQAGIQFIIARNTTAMKQLFEFAMFSFRSR